MSHDAAAQAGRQQDPDELTTEDFSRAGQTVTDAIRNARAQTADALGALAESIQPGDPKVDRPKDPEVRDLRSAAADVAGEVKQTVAPKTPLESTMIADVMEAVWRKVAPVAYAGNADSKESTRDVAHDRVNEGADRTKETVDDLRRGGHKVINKASDALSEGRDYSKDTVDRAVDKTQGFFSRGKTSDEDRGYYGPGNRAADRVNEGIQDTKERLPSGGTGASDARLREDASNLYDQAKQTGGSTLSWLKGRANAPLTGDEAADRREAERLKGGVRDAGRSIDEGIDSARQGAHDLKEGVADRADRAYNRAEDGLHNLRRETEDIAHRASHATQRAAGQVKDSVVGAGKAVNEAFKATVREYSGTEDYTVMDHGRLQLHGEAREELMSSRAVPTGGLLGLKSNTAALRARGAAV